MAESWCEGEDFILIAKAVKMIWISISVADPYVSESDRQKTLYEVREELELEK